MILSWKQYGFLIMAFLIAGNAVMLYGAVMLHYTAELGIQYGITPDDHHFRSAGALLMMIAILNIFAARKQGEIFW